jgi:predicted nucleotidyltransferase
MEEDFIFVTQKIKTIIEYRYDLSMNETINIIKNILSKYNVYSAFFYGSYARKQKKFNDIDILVIWNKKGIPCNIDAIKKEIKTKLNYPIDLVNMIYVGQLIDFDEKCKYFIEDNVYQDAINIFEHNKDIILESRYIGKI